MRAALQHVLIVDPNETVRAEVRRLLSQATAAPTLISEATTAEEALNVYSIPDDQRPDVIILAIDLCGKRGDERIQEIRTLSPLLSPPLIILGQDDDERIDKALSAGAYDWLVFTELNDRQLVRTLQNALWRHRAVQQAAADEKHLRVLVDSVPGLLWLSDTTKQRTFFNQVWLEFTGRTIEEERGFGWLEGVHEEDRERCFRTYSEAFDRREPFELEYRLRRYDGEYCWIMARGQPRYGADGRFQGYTGNCIDITRRRRVEEELRLNEERLRVVLNGSQVTVMTVDRDLRYTWVHNPQMGFTAELMQGKRDDELFPAEFAKPLMDFKREVFETEAPIRRELDFNWQGHTERYDTRAEPMRNTQGDVVGMTVVAINITERVRDEHRAKFLAEASRLLSSSLDYETTLQQVTNAMVPHLADWCSVDILGEAGQIVQVAVAHVDPEKVQWAKSLREHHPPSLDDPGGLALVLRTGKSEFYPNIPPQVMEEAIQNAEDEESREVLRSVGFRSLIIVPMITRNTVLGAITLVWSDSERHYDEGDLAFVEELAQRAATAVDHARLYQEAQVQAERYRSLSETLEQQVEERTKELQRSNQDLDQFAYIASHDLKAPLRAIDHLSTWVLEDVGHLLPERSYEHLTKMRSRIDRMEGLLDDLLTYSRAGRFRGEADMVDLNEIVARVIDTVSPPEDFNISAKGKLPTLYTYTAPLETVLRNLVNNAIKHHNKPNGNIQISAEEQGDMIEFAVTDDGPGIDPAFHERIFQMFQTLRPRDQVEGSGIGLAVVDKIVSSVGGTVEVESMPGKGATFRFTWPRRFQN